VQGIYSRYLSSNYNTAPWARSVAQRELGSIRVVSLLLLLLWLLLLSLSLCVLSENVVQRGFLVGNIVVIVCVVRAPVVVIVPVAIIGCVVVVSVISRLVGAEICVWVLIIVVVAVAVVVVIVVVVVVVVAPVGSADSGNPAVSYGRASGTCAATP
jgi:hypothetical protein